MPGSTSGGITSPVISTIRSMEIYLWKITIFIPTALAPVSLTLQSIPEAEYEVSELIILAPQAAFPLTLCPCELWILSLSLTRGESDNSFT